jgi:hypothetical protein
LGVVSKIEGNAPRATDLQSSIESKSSASPLFDDQSSIKYLLKGGEPPQTPPIVFLLMSVLHSIYAEPQHKNLFRVVRGGGGDF